MKNLILSILFGFVFGFSFGQVPDYDIGKEEVKVYVDSHGESQLIATVSVEQLKVTSYSDTHTVTAKFVTHQDESLIAIKTFYQGCESVGYVRKPKTKSGGLMKATIVNNSSGGLPRMYQVVENS